MSYDPNDYPDFEPMIFSDVEVPYGLAPLRTTSVEDLLADKLNLLGFIGQGIPASYFDRVRQLFDFTLDQWANLLNTSPKSLQRLKASNTPLKLVQGVRLFEVLSVMIAGRDFFGSFSKMQHWIKRSNTALGGSSPLKLMETSIGKDLILDQLVRMEHGIFI